MNPDKVLNLFYILNCDIYMRIARHWRSLNVVFKKYIPGGVKVIAGEIAVDCENSVEIKILTFI